MRWTLLFCLTCGVALSDVEKKALELSVEVQGVRSGSGNLLFLLFDKKKGFPSENKDALQTLTLPAKSPSALGVFKGLGAGTYAVCVIHDENADGKLGTNFLGIPREGVGVSRDAKGSFGPPSYEDAALEVLKSDAIQLRLNYL